MTVRPRAGESRLRVLMLAVALAALVSVARVGEAYWLCAPVVVLAATLPLGRVGVAVSTMVIVGSAAAPILLLPVDSLPGPLLAVLVPASSAAFVTAARERLERQRDALRDVALSDPLTGVANRRLLMARAEYEIARHARESRSFAVVMLDLDGFKLLNDRFGHAAGDELLCDVASSLSHAVRGQDTVARIGGDEFCVLAPETNGYGIPRLTNRIGRAVAGATAGVETRACLGVSIFPDDGETAAALLHAADGRLLDAKRQRPARARRRAA